MKRPPILLALGVAAVLALPPVVLHAAIAGTSLTAAGDTNAGNLTATTSSITPTANALVTACVLSTDDDGTTEAPTSVVGNGLNYVLMTSLTTDATGVYRLSSYRAMGASPSAGTVVITWPDGQTGAAWKIQEWTGVDTSGTDGSGAIVQVVDDVSSGGVTILNLVFAAFADATNNVAEACFGYANNSAFTADTGNGFAEISGENTYSTPGAGLGQMWKTGDASFSAIGTIATSGRMVGVGHEIKMAGAGAAVKSLLLLGVGDVQ